MKEKPKDLFVSISYIGMEQKEIQNVCRYLNGFCVSISYIGMEHDSRIGNHSYAMVSISYIGMEQTNNFKGELKQWQKYQSLI